MLLASEAKQAYEKGYDFVASEYKRRRTTSVVAVLPFSRQLYPAQKALEKRGLNVKKVKGAGLGGFAGGVAVTTYHQLKGLEFDHVMRKPIRLAPILAVLRASLCPSSGS